ncbi:hypothetical protein [Pedobacter endophyticus]|uniref:Lipoprotein n=1 Tax=Pedobacter endophyticus TaxID=2789740 RepID=A0A7S9L2W3_9SPHI|nr:hypothetical protein [Pedobacter endophyticus]QPH41443.1 hypothetical protein IZT61_09370 [Pedobacter endophyticus]
MTKNLLLFLSFLSLFFFSACKKDNIKNLNSISYGTSFGFCSGYCSNTLLISDSKLTFSKTKNGQTPDTRTCTKTISENEIAAIKTELNMSKITSLPEVIGCPDCADGGAEWVAVNADGKQYKVTYDYGKTPKELEAVVAKLKALKDSFNGCN